MSSGSISVFSGLFILQDDILWSCLAAMSSYAKELNTAEVAYAAIQEVKLYCSHFHMSIVIRCLWDEEPEQPAKLHSLILIYCNSPKYWHSFTPEHCICWPGPWLFIGPEESFFIWHGSNLSWSCQQYFCIILTYIASDKPVFTTEN